MICASWTCCTPLGDYEVKKKSKRFNKWRLCVPCRKISRHIQCLKCTGCGGIMPHTGQTIYCNSCAVIRDRSSKRMAAKKRNKMVREMKLLVLD